MSKQSCYAFFFLYEYLYRFFSSFGVSQFPLKNIIFDKGISLYAIGNNEKTVTVENCTVKYCSQYELLELVDANNNFRIDNSGNGLCLSFEGKETTGTVNVIVKDCTFIGDNDNTKPRKDSWPTTSDYLANKDNASSYGNFKGRGNGIGFGTQSGDGQFLKSASITNCSFEGLRNAAIQLYTYNAPITIEKCNFKSWGINSDEPKDGVYKSYAIRGNVVSGVGNDRITLSECIFDSTKEEYHKKIDLR